MATVAVAAVAVGGAWFLHLSSNAGKQPLPQERPAFTQAQRLFLQVPDLHPQQATQVLVALLAAIFRPNLCAKVT